MFYQDIDYDNNGTYDYRGVYFTQYRPINYRSGSSTSDSNQDDNGYSTNTTYWFSYDPIEWNILIESDGEVLILANLILDSQDYYPDHSTSTFSHNGGTGKANNYELSAIREFLNDTFYNTAFNDLQKTLIKETTVVNRASTTGSGTNRYACNNTNDKLFLLSYSEATDSTYGLNSDTARRAKGSDYARCQGLYVSTSISSSGCSSWWLRSPYDMTSSYVNPYHACVIGCDGMSNTFDAVDNTHGVRPACWITL